MANNIVWADIPVTDMDRAKRFYSELLGIEMVGMPGAEDQVAIRAGGEPGDVSFDLAKMDTFPPGDRGVRIYFGTNGDIAGMVERARAAGGEVVQEPQDMGGMVGTIAFVRDTEGNVIGLQQPSADQP